MMWGALPAYVHIWDHGEPVSSCRSTRRDVPVHADVRGIVRSEKEARAGRPVSIMDTQSLYNQGRGEGCDDVRRCAGGGLLILSR